jgi:hypothetical protein
MPRLFLLALTLLVSVARAADAPPSTTSVQELLTVMESRKLVESTLDQADAVLRSSMQQTLAGRELNTSQQAILDDFRGQSIAVLRETMQWETLEPKFVAIYRSSFTQDEVDGMLEFYRSAAGRAVIAKMPGAMQRSFATMRELVDGMRPRLQQLQNEALDKLEAAGHKPGDG